MEFDEIVVKESPGLCRCCLSEGCYKDLGTEYAWMDETEVYADMLLECFDISISQHMEGPNGPNRLICEVCITRLRDACNFKKQVLDSEKKFVDMVGRGEFKSKVIVYQEQMKSEMIMEPQPAHDADVEYLDEEIDYDDGNKDDSNEPTVSEDITVDALPIKGKRGRPKKTTVKPEKKKSKLEEKAKPKIVKGEKRPVMATEALIKSSMTTTKRNRLMKRNAIIILESSTAIPFKWHRHNYLCFFCHRPFKNLEPLKEHTRNDHKDSSIKSAVSYLKRDEKVKIDVTVINCKTCDESFDNINLLIEHVKVKHDRVFIDNCGYGVIPYKLHKDKFECALCQKDFRYFIKLNQHMNEHYGNYVCELCGKSFLSQDRLRCHSLSHGSNFRCSTCPEIFESLTQKNNHEMTVHNKTRTIKCFFCPETFQNYVLRKRHHNSAHNVEISVISCPVCGKSFHIVSKMWAHLKEVHVREKNFSCSLCDQKFFSRTHVQKHMIKHLGEKIHQCEVCKKSYARKQTLRDHMRIHNNDRRFICPVCSQAFVQNNSLRLHMKVHHSDSINA
ncbi:PR domain zinc finger protein 5-like isoform X8 [Vanessa atalanta]|uniref:PR domain zinc finger protein 5-like isoform X8 n=1 Tax=Vanessa atalanta TaxID=42275 RepID=UPI001FCD3603|nr:PR domain zinc finger protein 5-like isoform X8 [Vanessa atalanta]